MNFPIRKQNKTKIYSFLITSALVFAPYSYFRVGAIGITEVLCLLLVLSVLFQGKFKVDLLDTNKFLFTNFWIFFLFFCYLGFVYNYVILGHVSGTLAAMIYDSMAYIVVAIVCFCIELLISNNLLPDLWIILKKVFYFSSTLIFILFITSRFTDTIFNYDIVSYGAFKPFTRNIHHVTMSIAPLPFIGLKILRIEKNVFKKFLAIIFIITNILAAYNTPSFKVMLGFYVGVLLLIISGVLRLIKKEKGKFLFFVVFGMFSLIMAMFFSSQIIDYAQVIFSSEDQMGQRETLYASSFEKILKSPFVGFGPGQHGEGIRFAEIYEGQLFQFYDGDPPYRGWPYSDTHSSFLTVAIQAGLIALTYYILLHLKIIIKIFKTPYILGAYAGILIYALGGDITRRLPMFTFLMLFYYHSFKDTSSKKAKKLSIEEMLNEKYISN